MDEIDQLFKNKKKKSNINDTMATVVVPEKIPSELHTIEVQKTKKKKRKTKSIVVAVEEKEQVVTIDHSKKPEISKVPEPEDDDFHPKKRSKTDDGYFVYKEDELKIGLGKDTQDCPFDCDCCF
jgi:hypothetical protein